MDLLIPVSNEVLAERDQADTGDRLDELIRDEVLRHFGPDVEVQMTVREHVAVNGVRYPDYTFLEVSAKRPPITL